MSIMPNKDNVDLLERYISEMAAGDKAAVGLIYAQTKAAVYGFSLSILKNTQDSEDVLQETYIQLFKAAGQYQSKGKPMAWILTITKNLAFMALRKRKDNLDLDEAFDIGTASFEAQAEDRLVLNAALNALNEQERQIVILHSVSGLKHREIAELLELTLSAVLSKYNRAIKKLKKTLSEEE